MRVRHTGHMADAEVRPARTADVDALAAVQVRAWRGDGLLPEQWLELDESQIALEWARSLLLPGDNLLLAAFAGEALVGYAALGPSGDPDSTPRTGELLALEVDPDHRRAGHGSRLVAAVVDAARGRGLTDLTTWIPLDAEARRAFLLAAGWGPDTAYRDLDTGNSLLREVRLVTDVSEIENRPNADM